MVRIIPRLDIKGPNLVKGIHLEGLRVLGTPEPFARYYAEQGADELLFMDVVASLYQRNSLLELVSRISREIFIPLTVGGGLRTIEDIRMVLRAGADKVSLNTAAIRRPELIRKAAQRFGSSTIVVSIEAIKKPDGTYEAYTDNGRERTGVDAMDWALRAAELGAGELLVTSIDREGTGKGFDLELTRRIAESVPIPVIACGGAGRRSHVEEVVAAGRADAVCLASMLHYADVAPRTAEQVAAQEGNTEYLKSRRGFSKVQGATIPQIKAWLATRDVSCRASGDDSLFHCSERSAVPQPSVAIIDYEMGNLFSVKHACEHTGLQATITSSRDAIQSADAVILPGVGAFGDAMAALRRLDLISLLKDCAASGKPLMGVCLGMQLLMAESEEFGRHRGLGIIDGDVVRLHPGAADGRSLKVPQVGWNRIEPAGPERWRQSLLAGIPAGTWMYFVHSFYSRPTDAEVTLSMTRYGAMEFCSSLARRNVFACQFHPERSGPEGLRIYRQFAMMAKRTIMEVVQHV